MSESNEQQSQRWLLLLPSVEVDRDLASIAEGMFFHMWRTRQEPWNALNDGDTVYFVEAATRTLIWELRARRVRRTRYQSLDAAFRQLREAFGLFPEDLSDYLMTRPDEGFLLAWAHEVVAPLDIALPASVNFSTLGARHGYALLDKLTPSQRRSLRLPAPGRPALVAPPTWMAGDENFDDAVLLWDRYIPTSVRKAVAERANNSCEMCGSREAPLHFDHIYPVSKGGGNELDNIQLLCAKHNLEKAARVLSGVRIPTRRDVAAVLGRKLQLSSADEDLPALAEAGLAAGLHEDVAAALLQRIDFLEAPESLLPAISALPPTLRERRYLEARLACFIALDEPKLAVRLAQPLLDDRDSEVRYAASLGIAWARPRSKRETRLRLLTQAARSREPFVRGCAHASLADLARPDDKTVVRHLRRAADSPHPVPRAIAAFELAERSLGTDEVAAEAWYRRALITPDPEMFAECCVRLALLCDDDDDERACAYARHALESESEKTRDWAHFILGVSGAPDAEHHLELATKSKTAKIAKAARDAADEDIAP